MSSLRLATASNVRAFQGLTTALSTTNRKWAHAIDEAALEDEIGRFRVWAGNLGALQKGHSSLDYRLRDSPVSSTNTLKLLRELETNINEAYAVVSGARLPYEEQAPPDLTEDDDNDDGFFSAEEDDEDSSCDEPRFELNMRFREIVDIVDNLYKLSVRIRTPGLRSRSLKAFSYTQKDSETGVDVFDMYAAQDLRHVQELVSHLRRPYAGANVSGEQDFLIERLSAAVTLRRRHFKYWRRHRDKLGAATIADDEQRLHTTMPLEGPVPAPNDHLHTYPAVPAITTLREAPSQKTGKTLLSGTEATQLHHSLDDLVDTKSVTSYAVTVRDVYGKSIDLPPPPKTANDDKDFECPYCWVVCPARYSKGRAWRTHLLQDLQPYSCTYLDCDSSHLLFRSRREWAEHEASHRKVWRCPEHPAAVFSSQSGLENHLRQNHLDSFPESQVETIAKVGEATAVDTRAKCPICCAPADAKEVDDLQSHIANHLERIATFALPHGSEGDSDGASGIASPGSISSKSLPSSVSTDLSDEKRQKKENDDPSSQPDQPDQPDSVDVANPGRDSLSAENLQQLPDATRNIMDVISEQLDSTNSSYHQEQAHTPKLPPILRINDIPTLRSLYRSRRLLQTDQSYAPNDAYNRMISFCSYDLTRLQVDAIVNNAPVALKHLPVPGTLHRAVIEAGGPLLQQEVRSRDELKLGNVTWTHGYVLPSPLVIHAAAPTFVGIDGVVQFNILGDCYRNALNMAAELGIKTIAFPCLGTGGGNFSPRQAARAALQAVRDDFDARSDNRLERVVFCVKSAADEQAYVDFFPVFFPPTHGDIDTARKLERPANHATLVAQILNTRVRVQEAITALSNDSSNLLPEVETNYVMKFRDIDSILASIYNHSSEAKTLGKNSSYINLLCSTLLILCSSITEMTTLAKEGAVGTHAEMLREANRDMKAKHGIGLKVFLKHCWLFAASLQGVLVLGNDGTYMAEIRPVLESYTAKEQRQIPDDARNDPDEATSVEISASAASDRRGIVQIHQIPSVARLYQLGAIEAKATLARPSAIFNQTVCLVKEDITKLEVDVMVNSTDPSFQGMGALDRSVFKKGGERLQSELALFGKCKTGDVVTTQGYPLPAKHILHAIPPGVLRRDTKNILRNLYREILLKATYLKAKSVAIPCIGTGALNYPPRDCASLAMEEVRRFLQSKEPGGLEKIVFAVYSANDESVYKSLLPVYFPPDETASSSVEKQPRKRTGTLPLDSTSGTSYSSLDRLEDLHGKAYRNEQVAKITVDVAISDGSQETRRPVYKGQCVVRHLQGKVSVHEGMNSLHGYRPMPLLSFSMTRESNLFRLGYGASVSEVQKLSAAPDNRASVYFKCSERGEVKELCEVLETAIRHANGSLNEDEKGEADAAEDDVGSSSVVEKERDVPNSATDASLSDEDSSLRDRLDRAGDGQRPPLSLHYKKKRYEIKADWNASPTPYETISSAGEALLWPSWRARKTRQGEGQEQDTPEASSTRSTSFHANTPHPRDPAPAEQARAEGHQTAANPQHEPQQEIEKGHDLDPLSRRILAHLRQDLRTRPTSYIGQHINDMAAALDCGVAVLAVCLERLAARGLVHTTVDGETWVVSGEGEVSGSRDGGDGDDKGREE